MADKAHDLYPQIAIEKFTPYLKHPYESSENIKKLKGMKVVIIHGSEDQTTYPYHGEKLANIAKSAGIDVKHISVEGAGHINIDSNFIVTTALDAYKETSSE